MFRILFVCFPFPFFSYALDELTTVQLVETAMLAQQNAYAPYSNYYVGAAILTSSGKIYYGCNVENASYGLTNCAERTAVFKAVSDGNRDIVAVAVVTRNGGMPSGTCVVLNEFNPYMDVIVADETGVIYNITTLDQLLPYAFGPSNLD